MTPQTFTDQLVNLIDRSLADKTPLPAMIYQLGMAQHRIINLQLAMERRDQIQDMAKQIIPATNMPPNPKSN